MAEQTPKPTLLSVADFLNLSRDCPDVPLTDCWTDARQVTSGSVFIALQGLKVHGANFVEQAIERGASLILVESLGLTDEQRLKLESFAQQAEIACWFVEDLAIKLPGLVNWFYDFPSLRLKVIGITGTNGKTSSAHYCAQLLSGLGQKVALMGTLGNGLIGDLQPSPNTTLETVALQRTLARFAEQGVEVVIMEVSSHAVALKRIAGVHFFAQALTQVTRDHLDFHASLQDYRQVKAQFFIDYPAKVKIFNMDDELGRNLAGQLGGFGYGLEATTDLFFQNMRLTQEGIQAEVCYQDQKNALETNLLGRFNGENLLCALSLALSLGHELSTLLPGVTQLKPVEGRMQKVHSQPTVIVDYAHTPDALESVLKALKAHLSVGRLWVVFGCGGDRDVGKRPLMGQVAETWADQIILTDDNPRWESPEQIIRMIEQGLTQPVRVVHDRGQAIAEALNLAQGEDIVLVAGKGHEDYQELQGARLSMKDADLVANWYSFKKKELES